MSIYVQKNMSMLSLNISLFYCVTKHIFHQINMLSYVFWQMHCKPLLMHSKRKDFLNVFENVVRVFVGKNVLGIYLPALSKVDSDLLQFLAK